MKTAYKQKVLSAEDKLYEIKSLMLKLNKLLGNEVKKITPIKRGEKNGK